VLSGEKTPFPLALYAATFATIKSPYDRPKVVSVMLIIGIRQE
jgi:hypothetical protein